MGGRPRTLIKPLEAPYVGDNRKVYECASQGTVLFGHYGYERFGNVHRHQLGPVVVARNGATDTVDTATTLRAFDAFGAVRNGDLSNKADGKWAAVCSIRRWAGS